MKVLCIICSITSNKPGKVFFFYAGVGPIQVKLMRLTDYKQKNKVYQFLKLEGKFSKIKITKKY